VTLHRYVGSVHDDSRDDPFGAPAVATGRDLTTMDAVGPGRRALLALPRARFDSHDSLMSDADPVRRN
jgi:hypothetical protein